MRLLTLLIAVWCLAMIAVLALFSLLKRAQRDDLRMIDDVAADRRQRLHALQDALQDVRTNSPDFREEQRLVDKLAVLERIADLERRR